jgi:hypothetical protein
MGAHRLSTGLLLLAACTLTLSPSISGAGLFSRAPKGPPLLGSHPSSDARDARNALLKQHASAVRAPDVKPGKTVTSQRLRAGKTLLGRSIKR